MAPTWTIIRNHEGVMSIGKTGRIEHGLLVTFATIHLNLTVPELDGMRLYISEQCTHSFHTTGSVPFCPGCGSIKGARPRQRFIRGWSLLAGSAELQVDHLIATVRVQLRSMTQKLRIGRNWLVLEVSPGGELVLENRLSGLSIALPSESADPIEDL